MGAVSKSDFEITENFYEGKLIEPRNMGWVGWSRRTLGRTCVRHREVK